MKSWSIYGEQDFPMELGDWPMLLKFGSRQRFVAVRVQWSGLVVGGFAITKVCGHLHRKELRAADCWRKLKGKNEKVNAVVLCS
jgi:hypothetical protein